MEITEKVKIVTRLQQISHLVFSQTIASLQVGMSEADIAEMLRAEFKKKGIDEFWYDVPHLVTIGTERFTVVTTTTDYAIKSSSSRVFLAAGDAIHIDISPVDPNTKVWGDWSSTAVFLPKKGLDDEQTEFLKEFRKIQLAGIPRITAQTTGAEVAAYYLDAYRQNGITLLDVRNNVGHSIHAGLKANAERIWLDSTNDRPLGEGIYTIEPGGYREKKKGEGIVVARFEECIYVPRLGTAKILG